MSRVAWWVAGLAILGLVGASVWAGPPRAAAGPQQFKKVLNAWQDSYVTEGDTNANLGNAQQLRMGSWSGISNEPYFQFELPADFPSGATLSKATLRLWCSKSEFEVGQDGVSHIFLVSSPNGAWNGNTITYRNKPRLGAPRVEWSLSKCATNGEWREADILSIVQGWYDGSERNYGIGIEPKNDDKSVVFTITSREGDQPYPIGKQPQLVIEYSGGTTPTWTPSATPVPSDTPIPSETPIPSDTPVPTNTPVPTDTPDVTDTPVPTNTPVPTDTPRPQPVFLPLLLLNHDLMAPPPEVALRPAGGAAVAACRMS